MKDETKEFILKILSFFGILFLITHLIYVLIMFKFPQYNENKIIEYTLSDGLKSFSFLILIIALIIIFFLILIFSISKTIETFRINHKIENEINKHKEKLTERYQAENQNLTNKYEINKKELHNLRRQRIMDKQKIDELTRNMNGLIKLARSDKEYKSEKIIKILTMDKK